MRISAWDSQAEMELLRDLGRSDFWTFFNHIFGAHANPKGKVWIDPEIKMGHIGYKTFEGHLGNWLRDR